ncbi:MAG: hypothetical protein PUH26_01825 [Oscillospiraceae bacterium]|nr:hypothetical protein [Oscillospiraceae bacterium]MDY5580824.1 hypothetical protein [Oscillospiraceae bacterium]
MKTKKVGKIVSLLVAIVLVATIMIPAASVLADTGSNAVISGVDWNGEDVKIIGGDNAYGDLDAYLASLTPNSDKVYNIRLDADISLPKFGAYKDTTGNVAENSADAQYYVLASYGVFKDAYKRKTGSSKWSKGDSSKFGINEILGRIDSGSTYGADYNTLNATPSISTNPYKDVFKVAESGEYAGAYLNYDLQGKSLDEIKQYKNRFEELDTVQKKLMVGAAGNDTLGASSGNSVDFRTLTEYDDAMLCIKEGVKVCINLNGHKVSGLNSNENPFTGNPSYQTSIFVVRGELTVVDEHTTNAGTEVGMITGGSGSIYGKTQVGDLTDNYNIVDSSIYQGVAYFGVGLAGLGPDEWGDAYRIVKNEKAPDGNEWPDLSTESWSHSVGNYRIYSYYFQRYYSSVKEAHGGGVYVAPGATFTLMSGKISENAAWRVAGSSTKIFDNSRNPVACGGGVYVDENATFNMLGGEVSHNAVRAYQKTADFEPYAMGGGVYLASGATMNFKGGKVADNGTYAESNKNTNQTSQGGGIYVAGGATLNMMGNLSRGQEANKIESLLSGFPQVTGNGAGVYVRTEGKTGYAEGAGVYVAANGSFNVKNAVISANDFCEFSRYADKDSGFDNTTVPTGWLVTSVERDPDTGLAKYGTGEEEGKLLTKQILHENSGKFGVGMAYTGGSRIYTNGAGVCVADSSSRLVVGSRTWIYDNWDLVTNNHKAFDRTRYNKGTWNVDKQEYVYSTNYSFDATQMTTRDQDPNSNHKYCVGDGYCWSDTRDDVYLPDGVTLSVGESLFECKIGINYYNMVGNGATSKNESELGKESNRVFATSSDNLNYNVWGTTSASPRPRDIQYFYLNDNNKTYEYNDYDGLPDSTKTLVTRISYEKNGLLKKTYVEGTNYKVWVDNHQTAQAPVVKEGSGDYIVGKTPFEGYVNYGVNKEQEMYDAGTPYYTYKNVLDLYKLENNNQAYYEGAKIEDGVGTDRYPNFKHLYEVVSTSYLNPVYPQVAKELPDGTNANIGENVARFMDYKVIWDNNAETGFATTSEKPVLRFGKNTDRKMYVTVDFAESNKSYFGLGGSELNLNDSALKANVDSFRSDRTDYATVNQMTFDTVSGFKAKLTLGIPVPDYNLYKTQNLSGFTPNKEDTLSRDSKGNEDEDLYFKNWSFYTSYGYGPEIYTPDSIKGKSADEISSMTVYKTVNGTERFMKTRGVFDIDLAKINNTNLNAQPCPSLTAMWYTKEELAEARRRISGVKSQRAILDDGTVVLRAIAVVGKEYADYERAGFVVSTENPTPTVEGSYDYSIKGKIYKRILVNNEKGKSWVYAYNLASDLGFENGQDGKCGIVYTNFKIADNLDNLTEEAKNKIYFVTPYVYDEDTNTYYYGKSRAISYAYLEQMDAAAGN